METVVYTQRRKIPDINWSHQSLRQCLKTLGLSDEKMRYSRCPLMVSWAGHIPELIDLVKKTWKRQVAKVHEATGNDPQHWKMLNIVYSAALKKISRYQRKTDKPTRTITFTCHICDKSVTKKYVSRFQNKSFLCDDIECIRTYRRRKTKRLRDRYKINHEKHCENETCDKRIITTNAKRRFCCDECRLEQWNRVNAEKLKELSKKSHEKRTPWKVRYATLDEEEKKRIRERHLDARNRRLEQEPPEVTAARKAIANERMKAYRIKRKEEGRPIQRKYLKREEWLAKKKEDYRDKPWIYETILQKYQRPDGTISSVAIKIQKK